VEAVKLALIPPFSYLSDTKLTRYQLMLPHLVTNEAYSYTYEELGDNKDQFVILDNGEAEGVQQDWFDLQDMARSYRVNEIVLPDVIADRRETQKRVAEAMTQWQRIPNVGLMYVLQGKTWGEIEWSFEDACHYSAVTTIGIPRHLPETLGYKHARWNIVRWIMAERLHMLAGRDIHFLGMHPQLPREMEQSPSARVRKMVRGFDTSAPYNFAEAGALMQEGATVRRPDGYFDLDRFDQRRQDLLTKNIAYLSWCAEQ
jgi:hypothetical protein